MSTSVETSVVSARVDALLWPEVFIILKARIAKYGGEIEFKNLAPLYENVYPRTDLRRLLYTGLSDGKKIALHQDRAKIGSPVRWTWDALHLFGHMFQWHINRAQASSRSLKYWGTDAQAMATRNFLGSSIDDLRRMQNYELEANRFSLSLFLDCLKEKRGSVMTNHLQELMDEFCCYTAKDIVFLTSYYAGAAVGAYSNDLLSHDGLIGLLMPVTVPTEREVEFIELGQICVPVIHELN